MPQHWVNPIEVDRGEARRVVFEEFKLFEPGTRVAQLVAKGYQMMDQYYLMFGSTSIGNTMLRGL